MTVASTDSSSFVAGSKGPISPETQRSPSTGGIVRIHLYHTHQQQQQQQEEEEEGGEEENEVYDSKQVSDAMSEQRERERDCITHEWNQ